MRSAEPSPIRLCQLRFARPMGFSAFRNRSALVQGVCSSHENRLRFSQFVYPGMAQ